MLRLAFLEFMQPSILEAGLALADEGCDQVDVVPLFLGAGGHVRKDLPVLLAQLRAAHPLVDWRLRPAIGEVPQRHRRHGRRRAAIPAADLLSME